MNRTETIKALGTKVGFCRTLLTSQRWSFQVVVFAGTPGSSSRRRALWQRWNQTRAFPAVCSFMCFSVLPLFLCLPAGPVWVRVDGRCGGGERHSESSSTIGRSTWWSLPSPTSHLFASLFPCPPFSSRSPLPSHPFSFPSCSSLPFIQPPILSYLYLPYPFYSLLSLPNCPTFANLLSSFPLPLFPRSNLFCLSCLLFTSSSFHSWPPSSPLLLPS